MTTRKKDEAMALGEPNHMRTRLDVLALLAAVAVAGCGKARDEVPLPPPTPAPVDPVPTKPGWQLDLPLSGVVDVVEQADGRIVVVADIAEADGTIQIAGRSIASRGLGDVVIVVVSATGTIENVAHLGGPRDEAALELTILDGRVVALVETTGGFELAGTTVPATKTRPGGIGPVHQCLLVEFGVDGEPSRVVPAFPAGRVWRPSMVVLAGGDLAIAGQVRPEGPTPRSLLQRRDARGALRWEREVPEELWGIFASTGGDVALFASYTRDSRFGVIGFDDDGQEVRRIELANVRPTAGETGGAITQVVVLGSDLWLFGHAGGDIKAGDRVHRRPRSPEQPFLARATASGIVNFADLTRAIAMVRPAGPHHAMVTVLHPSDADLQEHRGLYLVRDFTDDRQRRLVPLSLIRYENDNWKDGEPIHVVGPKMRAHRGVILSDGAILLLGTGDGPGGSSVIARVLP